MVPSNKQMYVEPEDRTVRVSDLLLRYGVILGKRFSRRQKRRFLAAAAKQFELYGYECTLEKDDHLVKTAGSKSYLNLYSGDLHRAKYLFVTYYDTPTKRFSKDSVKAFSANFRTQDVQISIIILLAAVAAAAFTIGRFIWPRLAAAGALSFWGLLFFAVCAAVLALVTRAREGFSERDNMVRNSSSLVILFDLARQARDKGLADEAAFALVDEGCRSEQGLKMLSKHLGKHGPKRVYLDSFGSDGKLFCLTSLGTPISWEGVVDIRRLSAEKRRKYGDYLMCAGTLSEEDISIDSSSEVGVERVVDRTTKLLELVRG